MQQTDLSTYNNSPFHPGSNVATRLLWYFVNVFFFKSGWFPINGLKLFLLRLFGAKVGKRVTVKPGVNIKYPWHLIIGDHCWIGENVWIDSLVPITIGNNVCLSQGAILLTGSHNYKKPSFNLITAQVTIEDGAWICAGAMVNPGVMVGTHAVLTSGSVANHNLEAYAVYQGNPAIKTRQRIMH